VLTGGCRPGLNAVIRAVACKGEMQCGDQFIGFLDGWRGVIEGDTVPLDADKCAGILATGDGARYQPQQPLQSRRRSRQMLGHP